MKEEKATEPVRIYPSTSQEIADIIYTNKKLKSGPRTAAQVIEEWRQKANHS